MKSINNLLKNQIFQSIAFLVGLAAVLALTSKVLSSFVGDTVAVIVPYLQEGGLIYIIPAYFIYSMLQAVIVIIPATVMDITMYVLIGPWLTFVTTIFGTLVGYTLSYAISRRYGRKALKKILPIKVYNFVIEASNGMKWKHFFVLTMLPFSILDAMPFIGGLSKIKYKRVIFALILATSYRVAFTLFVFDRFWHR